MKTNLKIFFSFIFLFITVWGTAFSPKTYWNQDEDYENSTIHVPLLFAEVSDGVVEEITGFPQLTKLGCDVATKVEVRKGLWESVKTISVESIKNAVVNFYEEKNANYTGDKEYIVNHTLGKDAAQVASMFYGGFAAKGRKLAEAVEESGGVIKKKIDDVFEETRQLSKQKLERAADSKVLSDFCRGLPV